MQAPLHSVQLDPRGRKWQSARSKVYVHSVRQRRPTSTSGLGSKDELQNLSVEEQHSFFQKLAVEKANAKDSRIDWKTVRACLVTSLTTRQMTENATAVDTQFLPLDVWLKQGWPEQTVRNCPKEWNEQYGCDTYQVPVKSMTWSRRTKLWKREFSVRRRRPLPSAWHDPVGRRKLSRKRLWICRLPRLPRKEMLRRPQRKRLPELKLRKKRKIKLRIRRCSCCCESCRTSGSGSPEPDQATCSCSC